MGNAATKPRGAPLMSRTRSVVLVSLLTPVGLVLGLASNWLIVRVFGLSPELDAYFVAYLFPSFAGGVIAEFLGRNFIPTLDRLVINRSKRDTTEYISAVISFSIIASLGLTVIFWIVIQSLIKIVAPGLTFEYITLAVSMANIMLTGVVFMTINVFHEYIHQVQHRFFRPQLAQLAVPVVTLGSVLIFGHSVGAIVLAWAFLAGQVIIFIALIPGLDYKFKPTLRFRNPEVWNTIISSGWLMLSGTLSYARGFIERYLASLLGSGAVSAIALAARFSAPLQQGAGLGMKLVAFRRASELVAAGKNSEAGHLSLQVISIVIMLLVQVSIWLAVDADLLIKVLFASRSLGTDGQTMLTETTRGFLLAVPIMAVAPILTNIYFVLNKSKYVVIARPITLIGYIFCLYLLYKPLGVFGITLANLATFFISFLIISWHISKLLDGFKLSDLWINLMRYFFIAILSSLVVEHFVRRWMLMDIMTLVIDGVISHIIYFVVLFVLRDKYFQTILEKLSQRKN